MIVSGIDEQLLLEGELEISGVAIIRADENLIIIKWSEAASALLGWSSGQMLGQNVLKIIPPSLKEQHKAGVIRYRGGGEANVIDKGPVALKALHKDGHEIPITLNLSKNVTSKKDVYYFGAIIPTPPPHQDAPTLDEVEKETQ